MFKRKKKKKDSPKWTLPEFFHNNVDDYQIDFIEIILDESEKYLDASLKVGDNITKKAYTILGVASPIMTVSLGYWISEYDWKGMPGILIMASMILSIITLITIILLSRPLFSYEVLECGTPPCALLHPQMVSGFDSHDKRLKNMKLNLCVNHQDRIDFNLAKNKKRTKQVDIALILLVASPFISLVTSGIIYFIGYVISNACYI